MILRHTHSTLRALSGALILTLGSGVSLGAQDRMPPIPADKMTDAQKTAAAEFRAARNTDPNGPFGVLLRVPDLMTLGFKWREHVQLSSGPTRSSPSSASSLRAAVDEAERVERSLPGSSQGGTEPRTSWRRWRRGGVPRRWPTTKQSCTTAGTELHRNQSVSDATYARALAKFGEPGIVEAASIEGYYTLLAMVMNVARTPLPAGAKPPLAAFPH